MEVISLSGDSGTGKSTIALAYAYNHEIDGIIDDGLYIYKGSIAAGTSAKFEKSAITAVKRAIFMDEEHLASVEREIHQTMPNKLLILGTSEKMTKKISQRLNVHIDTFIHIEDIQEQKQIQLATFMRHFLGQHTMPVPMQQVQQNFFSRLIQRGIDILSTKREKIGETTIVQPDFHQNVPHRSLEDIHQYVKDMLEQDGQLSIIKSKFLLQPYPYFEASVTFHMHPMHRHSNTVVDVQKYVYQQFLNKYQLPLDNFILHIASVQFIEEI